MEFVSVIVVAVLGLIGNVVAATINSNKTTAVMQAEIKASDEKLDAKIESSNALVGQKVGEIQKDIGNLSERVSKHNNLVERMAIVEQSAKSAHKRLDDAGVGRPTKQGD